MGQQVADASTRAGRPGRRAPSEPSSTATSTASAVAGLVTDAQPKGCRSTPPSDRLRSPPGRRTHRGGHPDRRRVTGQSATRSSASMLDQRTMSGTSRHGRRPFDQCAATMTAGKGVRGEPSPGRRVRGSSCTALVALRRAIGALIARPGRVRRPRQAPSRRWLRRRPPAARDLAVTGRPRRFLLPRIPTSAGSSAASTGPVTLIRAPPARYPIRATPAPVAGTPPPTGSSTTRVDRWRPRRVRSVRRPRRHPARRVASPSSAGPTGPPAWRPVRPLPRRCRRHPLPRSSVEPG